MKKNGEEELPSLQKQVSSVLKSCNPDDEEKLRSIVKGKLYFNLMLGKWLILFH